MDDMEVQVIVIAFVLPALLSMAPFRLFFPPTSRAPFVILILSESGLQISPYLNRSAGTVRLPYTL